MDIFNFRFVYIFIGCIVHGEAFVSQLNDSYYQYFPWSVRGSYAQDYCKNDGGYLVSINSLEEREFVDNFFDDATTFSWVWIGLSDHNEQNGIRISGAENDWWVWEDGSNLTHDVTSWAVAQPNSNWATAIYVALFRPFKKWYNRSGSNPYRYPFICEYIDACAQNMTSCQNGGVCVSEQ